MTRMLSRKGHCRFSAWTGESQLTTSLKGSLFPSTGRIEVHGHDYEQQEKGRSPCKSVVEWSLILIMCSTLE